jgi:uncharacterized protein YggU (UPF0235/DUF167 family)
MTRVLVPVDAFDGTVYLPYHCVWAAPFQGRGWSVKAVREAPGGSLIEVRVCARSRPSFEVTGEHVVIRVAAPPVEGRATDEARRSLAAALHVPPTAVRLVAGARARTKKFLVGGLDEPHAVELLHGVSVAGR